MKKKLLAVLLASAMILTTLAGCSGNEASAPAESQEQTEEAAQEEAPAEEAATEETTEEAAPAEEAADTEEAAAETDYSNQEEYTVKIVCVGDATTESCEEVAAAASEITKAKFNTTIELVRLSYGSFYDEVNLMLSSGEKLDLFPNFAFSSISTPANTGQVLPLDDLLAEYGQFILQDVPEAEWKCETVNGEIYGVPNNKDKSEGYGLAVRTDMLEATGYDISTIKTEADLEGLFAAVKELYPDCYPLVSDNGQMGYAMLANDSLGGDYGILENCVEDGIELKVTDWYQSAAYEEMVNRRYDWAQKGYILPDAANNSQNAYELLATGRGFAFYTNTKPGIENERARQVGKDITVIPLVDALRTSTTGMNTWFIAHNSEKPERAMQVLNEMRENPELSNLLINGIEGEHYVVDEEAGVLTYPEGVDASNTTYSSVAWIWPNELISTPWEADGPDIWTETDAFNKSAKLSKAFGFMWDNSNVLNEITACNNVKAKYVNALECGSLNPADALPQMIQELKDAGVDTIIAEKQAQLDAWAAAQ